MSAGRRGFSRARRGARRTEGVLEHKVVELEVLEEGLLDQRMGRGHRALPALRQSRTAREPPTRSELADRLGGA